MLSERFSRQIMLPEVGPEGQRLIGEASVLIVGLGGLGCPVGLYLAGAGVGRLGLCDADTVSLSNLQRQTLYDRTMTGMPKTEAALQRLQAVSPETEFELHREGLTPDSAAEIISRYDIVVDCCDNFATRYLIDDACRALGKPWVHGALGEFTGQVCVFTPGAPGYADLYPDRDVLGALPAARGGVLGAVPGVVGSLQAAEVLKLIIGMPSLEGMLTIDLRSMEFNNIKF